MSRSAPAIPRASISVRRGAYPAQLQKLLKQNGIDAEVINAGVPFDTTAVMLRRIDSDVPKGTDIVILQPGANDRRFFTSKQQRTANIAEMERRLRARGIKVVIYDEEIPLRYYTFDFIHLTREGHAMIAAALLPRIMATRSRRSAHGNGRRRRRSRPANSSVFLFARAAIVCR